MALADDTAIRRQQDAASREAICQVIKDEHIHTVVLGGTDLNGVSRGKRLPVRQFIESAVEHGIGFSDCLFISDIQCEFLPDVVGGLSYFPTAETGYPDVRVVPDLSTFVCVPWEPGVATVMGDFEFDDGRPVEIAPRQVLKRAIARAESLGYAPYMGAEFEFHVFAEDLNAIHSKRFRDLQPLFPRPNTYSALRSALDEDLLGDIRRSIQKMGIALEGSNAETGRGQYEVNIRYSPTLQAADNAVRFKDAVKEICARRGLLASFMAKWGSNESGSSGHLHMSLWKPDLTSAFWDEGAEFHMSDVLRSFVAGQLATMPGFTAVFCPTVNSYKRLRGESWTGSTVTWDVGNRSVSLRLIMDSPSAARVEHRVPGADMNPYLAMAACLLGGLQGIEKGLELPARTTGNAYARSDVVALPASLEEAVNVMANSQVAKELLGPDVYGFYLNTRYREVDVFRGAVTDFEVERYLDQV